MTFRSTLLRMAFTESLLLALTAMAYPQASTGGGLVARAEVVRVSPAKSNLIEVKLRLINPWGKSVYIRVCDNPVRLDSLFTYPEYHVDGKWKKIPHSPNIVPGDLPGYDLEVKPKASVELPYQIAASRLPQGSWVRIVVLAHTKTKLLARGISSPRFVSHAFRPSEPMASRARKVVGCRKLAA